MKNSLHRLSLMLFTVLFVSCISNDVPFPRITQDILKLSAVGESSPAVIDNNGYEVTLTLGEDVDIRNVRFSEFEITPDARCSVNLLDGTYDLSSPLKITLSKYQDYEWIIKANQVVERYFTISGQIGESVIDEVGRRIVVYVPDNFNLSALELTSIKLGPDNQTTVSPTFEPGIHDFSRPVHLRVSAFGRTENWSIYVEKSKAMVTTIQADAWSRVVWVYGNAKADADNGFQYKAVGDDAWIDVPAEYITYNGGTFSAYIPHLKPLTQYVVRAVSDDYLGNEIVVQTDDTRDLPGGSFDRWWLDGKVWCPWDENGTRYWDTGNKGASTLGDSNVIPTDYTSTGSGLAAQLETRFVGIGSIGKLAAGSIYTGVFQKVDGTNGILDFGREWNLRPTKLKGYFQYKTAPINYASTEFKHLMGRPDTCHIYIALADWSGPYEVRTNPKNRRLFDKNAPEIIAYGELLYSGSMNSYKEFEITLNYRSTSRKPKYILVTCAASKYGDFFTGGTGAVMHVDQLSLEYDY